MGQITATRILVATKVVRHAGVTVSAFPHAGNAPLVTAHARY